MKQILILICICSFSFCYSQEVDTAAIDGKEYIFESEYKYSISRKRDTSYVTAQFTGAKFVKGIYTASGSQFTFLDNAADFFAIFRDGRPPEINSFSDMLRSELERGPVRELKKVDDDTCNGTPCEVYHLIDGNDLWKLYFDKEVSNTFNPILAKLFNIKGALDNTAILPKGKFLGAKQLRNELVKSTIELLEAKENQNIRFRLKTSE